MAKRRIQDSNDCYFDAEDNPIGLTGAFAPVKGPQSVEYAEGDEAIGLTQAFEPIPDQDEPRAWDEEGKWKNFDWEAYKSERDEMLAQRAEQGEKAEGDEAHAAAGEAPAAEGAAPAEGEAPAREEQRPAKEAPEKIAPRKGQRGRHAAADDAELSPRMKKSRRTRRVLTVIVILLIVLIAAMGFFMYRTFQESQQQAAQQAQDKKADNSDSLDGNSAADAVENAVQLTDVPNLVPLFGKTVDEAVAQIGHGAIVTANKDVDDEGSAIKKTVNIALTEEPADSKTGTPTVYLGLNEDGKVIQVGYSASASALGFGSLSFADAVSNEHVVEKTLAKIGVNVPEGSVKLPEDKKSYSTYASDGTTVIKESCSFEGNVDVNGTPCLWSAVLRYDYTTQVVTGNLNDTVRIIYVYVTMK